MAEPCRLSIVYVIALKVFNEVSTGGQMKTSAHGSSGRMTKQDQAEAMSRMYVHQVSFAIRPPLRPPLSAVRPASCRADEIAARQSRDRADVFVVRLKPSRALDCLPTCTDESTACYLPCSCPVCSWAISKHVVACIPFHNCATI